MKTFEQHNKIEDFIVQSSHLDELNIKFNFFNYLDNGYVKLYYFYDDDCMIVLIKESVYISTNKYVWDILMKEYNLDGDKISNTLRNTLMKYLKIDISDYNIYYRSEYRNEIINKSINI